ncbi:MAG TPA: hypothetical protein VMR98_03740 [Candidatus Polarisedimenticolaceae bacterium]|nr:hypothetical protein [Candidatus Polarisedimenticolaceae bacterium]
MRRFSSIGRISGAVALFAAVVAVLGVQAVQAPPANAASSVSACFSYPGLNPAGLSTNLEILMTKRHRDYWERFAGTNGYTNAQGCVRYRVAKRHRGYFLRIAARAVVPAWNALVDGATVRYARPGNRSANLRTWTLNLAYLPATAPPFGGVNTKDWLDGMSSGPNTDCTSSPAAIIACDMDANNQHASLVVLDYDGDGVDDTRDAYWQDPTRW